MRVLLSWLADHVEIPGDALEVARILTGAGFPVPSVEPLDGGGSGPGGAGSPPDAILEVEITSNRGDCMSHLGIARELAAASGLRLRTGPAPGGAAPGGAGPAAASLVSVEVEAGDLCPSYEARVLLDVRNGGPTPPGTARRLAALGLRPVNPIVDVTNFVMLDRGQPLHAFDRSRLRGGRIVVRRSLAGEVIETIDGRRRELPAGLLVIADAERPVAVAGVMGSRDTEVGPSTREVVLESARFSPAAVRASASALGLATEASARFSRRVDPSEREASAGRAMDLMAAATGGRAAAGAVLAGPGPAVPPPRPGIGLRTARLQRVLGVPVPAEEAAGLLSSLGLEILSRDAAGLRAAPPSWRADLSIEEDLVEEVARIRGYDRIPAALSLPVRPVPPRRAGRLAASVRAALAGAGFREALTLPFTAPGPLDDASPWTALPALRVDNPTRSEEPLLRRSLLGPLLRCLERNRARGVPGVRLFELGTAFLPSPGRARPEERLLLSGVVEGDYADARGAVDAAAEALGLSGRIVVQGAPPGAAVSPLDPSRTARFLLGDRTAGFAGEIRAADLEGLGVHREGLRAAAFELDYDLLAAAAAVETAVVPPPTHPQASRDLALLFPLSVPWAEVEARTRAAAGRILREVVLFDDYRGKGVPAGSRSLAFRLVLGDPDRTLRGEEVEAAVAAVVASLEGGLGGRLRGPAAASRPGGRGPG